MIFHKKKQELNIAVQDADLYRKKYEELKKFLCIMGVNPLQMGLKFDHITMEEAEYFGRLKFDPKNNSYHAGFFNHLKKEALINGENLSSIQSKTFGDWVVGKYD